MSASAEDGTFAAVYAVVRRIPPGRVATYGDVAAMACGSRSAARVVGWALRALPTRQDGDVPWWRVINAQGKVSTGQPGEPMSEQRARLEDEGVEFGVAGKVSLSRFGWDPE